MHIFISIFFSFIISVIDCQHHYSISQISPKSLAYADDADSNENIKSSLAVELINDKMDAIKSESVYVRVERSALPILNEGKSLTGNENRFEIDKAESSGRYYNSIDPTLTSSDDDSANQMTKNVQAENFLVKRGRSSRPQLKEVNSVMPMETATKAISFMPRQNNPDIQDIITGIVKLLNGNVNVHANNQGQFLKPPNNNRINNRGPPRISEAQVSIGDDNQEQMPLNNNNNNNKPSYERPADNSLPIRPFLTGVPLPEQIVPSMQAQNYRPGFVSQNRPPWKRPNPRPPTGFQRRPILHQQHMLHQQMQHQQNLQNQQQQNLQHQHQQPQTIPTHFGVEKEKEVVEEHEEENDDDEDEEKPEVEQITNNHVINSFNDDSDRENQKLDDEKYGLVKNETAKKEDIQPTTVFTIIQSTSEVNTVQELFDSTTSDIMDTSSISQMLESSFANDISSSMLTSTSSSIVKTPTILDTAAIKIPSTFNSLEFDSSSSLSTPPNTNLNTQYRPRPGMVLDDPEFKPGHKTNHQGQPPPQLAPRLPPQQQQKLPPGYGEIFDVTLSAIQGPSGNTGSQQTINIRPFGGGSYDGTDILLTPSGDQGFVSIDGKRTYLNLFGESSDLPLQISSSQVVNQPQIKPTNIYQQSSPPAGITGTGYVIAETEPTIKKNHPQNRPIQRPRQPPSNQQSSPVRIDTCIVGDDSTCDQTQNEKCKTENGVSSCNCKPGKNFFSIYLFIYRSNFIYSFNYYLLGYARRKHREPCRKIVSLLVSIRVDRYHDRKIVWSPQLNDTSSEQYRTLKYESFRAIDSAMSMTPFSDEFMDATINKIYQGDASKGLPGVFVNFTLMIEENLETTRPTIRNEIQRHLIGVIHRRNNNIGNSALFVDSPPGSVSAVQDLDECLSHDLNDCHSEATCRNIWGSYT